MMKRKPGFGLFARITTAVVAGVVAVTICTLTLALRSTERSYVETISVANRQMLQDVVDDMSTANDLITRIILFMGDSIDFQNYLTADSSSLTAYQSMFNILRELGEIIPTGGYDTLALSADGERWFANNDTSPSLTPGEILDGALVGSARREPNRIHYAVLGSGITARSAGAPALVAVKALTKPHSQIIYGYGFVVVRQSELQEFYDKINTASNTLLLVDADGVVVSGSDAQWLSRQTEAQAEELAAALDAMGADGMAPYAARLNGAPVTLQYIAVPQWGVRMVTVLDQKGALKEMGGQFDIAAVCVLVCVLVLAAVFLILRQLLHPLRALVDTMRSTPKGGIAEHVPVQGDSETKDLALAFNGMVDDLHSYVNQLLALEQEKRHMELEALQMQIKPHFIYNTLTSIKWLIWQKEGDKATRCVDALTLLLRGTLGDQRELVSAGEELDTLKSYVFLQQIRYGDRVRVNWYLSPAIEHCQMPKLLLQPLVENAFFHAFTGRPGGTISVFVDKKGGDLVCEVMDDGVGMTAQAVAAALDGTVQEAASRTSGIGLANVDQRVKMIYGGGYGVQIFSEPGAGTTVRVTLPCREAGQKSTKA